MFCMIFFCVILMYTKVRILFVSKLSKQCLTVTELTGYSTFVYSFFFSKLAGKQICCSFILLLKELAEGVEFDFPEASKKLKSRTILKWRLPFWQDLLQNNIANG